MNLHKEFTVLSPLQAHLKSFNIFLQYPDLAVAVSSPRRGFLGIPA